MFTVNLSKNYSKNLEIINMGAYEYNEGRVHAANQWRISESVANQEKISGVRFLGGFVGGSGEEPPPRTPENFRNFQTFP